MQVQKLLRHPLQTEKMNQNLHERMYQVKEKDILKVGKLGQKSKLVRPLFLSSIIPCSWPYNILKFNTTIILWFICVLENTRRLDAFLSAHTSEDNESFQEIMKEADIRHRHKVSNLFIHVLYESSMFAEWASYCFLFCFSMGGFIKMRRNQPKRQMNS